MQVSKKKKVAAAVGAGAIAVAGSGVAFAYWTTSGDGHGSGTIAAANGTLGIHDGADRPAGVTPGSETDFTLYADNAGTTDLRVGTVSTVVSSSDAACQTLIESGDSGLSVADVDTSGSNVAAETNDVVIGTATLVYANSATVNQDACRNVSLILTFTGTAS
jgi:hypothetical protein